MHFVDDGIDTGDILLQKEFPVLPHATETSLIKRSVEVGAPLLVRAVESIITGIAQRKVQDESEATYYGFPREHGH